MAIANLDTNKAKFIGHNISKALTFTAIDTTDGAYFTPTAKSGNILIVVKALGSTSHDVIVKKATTGDSPWKNLSDLTIATGTTANAIHVAMIDTARYLRADGTILITCSAAETVAVVELA